MRAIACCVFAWLAIGYAADWDTGVSGKNDQYIVTNDSNDSWGNAAMNEPAPISSLPWVLDSEQV